VPTRLIDDADRWLKTARLKLDNFTKNSENPHFIAFEMLENKSKGGNKMSGEDFIDTGENILSQLTGQKDVSVQKVESMIGQLSVQFNQNAIKSINELCKCSLIEGVNAQPDSSAEDEDARKNAHKFG